MIGIKSDWNLSKDEIKKALLHRAIDSIQKQAGYVPARTENEIEIMDIAWVECGLPDNEISRWTNLETGDGQTIFIEHYLSEHTTYLIDDFIPF